VSQGVPGDYLRQTSYPALSNIVGYTDPTYGQSGLEASLDAFLRGLQGNSLFDLWWNHLAFGQSPEGLDVRLSLDLELQQKADELLEGRRAALVLLNAENGEILAISSHPTFDANLLAEDWQDLVVDPDAPLLNRAILGRYAIGGIEQGLLDQSLAELNLDQVAPAGLDTGALADIDEGQVELSPLQMALAAAAISGNGSIPSPSLVTAVKTPDGEWTPFTQTDMAQQALPASAASRLVQKYKLAERGLWGKTEVVQGASGLPLTWFLGGYTFEWGGAPLSIAVLLEEAEPTSAQEIGLAMLQAIAAPQP
jgi:cell division protein FtsI/penicillin-binding protein 2